MLTIEYLSLTITILMEENFVQKIIKNSYFSHACVLFVLSNPPFILLAFFLEINLNEIPFPGLLYLNIQV